MTEKARKGICAHRLRSLFSELHTSCFLHHDHFCWVKDTQTFIQIHQRILFDKHTWLYKLVNILWLQKNKTANRIDMTFIFLIYIDMYYLFRRCTQCINFSWLLSTSSAWWPLLAYLCLLVSVIVRSELLGFLEVFSEQHSLAK